MELNLLDKMLQTCLADRKTVTVTLQNKVRVTGKVAAFDSYIVVLDGQKREIIYRHAVSSLCLAGTAEARPQPAQPKAPLAAPRQKSARPEKARPASPQTTPAGKESGINNTMKEGLLKWMEGQKAK